MSDYVLGPSQNSITINHDEGDVLLGIFIQGKIQGFHTEIAERIVHTNPLARNGFYPVLPETFLPVICLVYHTVRLFFNRLAEASSVVSLRFAFGQLGCKDRRELCLGTCDKPIVTEVADNKQLQFRCGMGGITGPYVWNDPSYTHLPKYCLTGPCLKEKMEWQHTINQDLMQKAWHPDRLTKWCLDTEELVDLSL